MTPGAIGHVGSWRPARATACLVAFVAVHALAAATTAAHAQLIAVKTAPVSDGGQFAFLPSANLGLGGLSIALADSAHDPFVNPAKGARLTGVYVFTSPTFFSVSRKAGGGLTLPVGVTASSRSWFGQFAVAMQEIDKLRDGSVLVAPTVDVVGGVVFEEPNQRSQQNRYAHGLVGRRFANQLSLAASASWWRINALDGVELYYPIGARIQQHGETADLRLGLLKTLSRGQTIEVVALHNRFAVNHDVSFVEMFWNPSLRSLTPIGRVEPNADRTRSWGMHVGYTQPLADSTWRIGAIATGNAITQASLPGFHLPQVPGDAGRAHAYNLGAGVVRSGSMWTVGLDAIFEPIWNRTWVHADKPAETLAGTMLSAGTRTLESDFRFTNAIARLGVAARAPISTDMALTFEAGGQMRAMRYRLEQQDAIRDLQSASTQRWNEWTRSWGVSFRAMTADVRYRGQMTTGARRPGFDDFGAVINAPRPLESSFIGPLPSATLPFSKVRATTHQISLSVPIR
jgi:hypothetical protein